MVRIHAYPQKMKKIFNVILVICFCISYFISENNNIVSDFFGQNTKYLINNISSAVFFLIPLLIVVNNWQFIKSEIKFDDKTQLLRLRKIVSKIFPKMISFLLFIWFLYKDSTNMVLGLKAGNFLLIVIGFFILFYLYFIVKFFSER